MKAIFCRETLWDDSHSLSTNYLAQALARRGWEVLWLARPWHPYGLLLPRWWRKKAAKIRSWVGRRGSRPENNVRVYTFATLLPYRHLPFLRSFWVGRNTLRFGLPPVRRQLLRLGFDHPDLLVVSDLAQLSLLDLVRARRVVFHVTDDYTAFPRTPPSARSLERWAVERADVVVAPQRQLASLLADRHAVEPRKVRVVPHGVQVEAVRAGKPPTVFQRVPPPHAVFLGALEDWIDWDLVQVSALALPHLSFTFIGEVRSRAPHTRRQVAVLRQLPNVHFLGPLPHQQAMACLAESDAALIPFRPSPLKETSAPMKLLEYLSFGLPVVSTHDYWRQLLSPVHTPVFLADDAERFATALGSAVTYARGHRRVLREAGVTFAQENSWDRRIQLFLEHVTL